MDREGRQALEIMISMGKTKLSLQKEGPRLGCCFCFIWIFPFLPEMLSKPRIFHDAKSEIIKGQAVGISCQSANGTAPITYHLMKAKSNFQTLQMKSNDPATFTDKPTRDVEYQCIADNCHSHPEVHSDILRVKVIGEELCGEKQRWGSRLGVVGNHRTLPVHPIADKYKASPSPRQWVWEMLGASCCGPYNPLLPSK